MKKAFDIHTFYREFCTEQFGEDGALTNFSVHCPQNFNFGYDIVDRIAAAEPRRRALVWTDDRGGASRFTFADISKRSNQVANMLLELGIKKGDPVLVILKRHYEYWFTIVALHKIGAIAVPATHMLTTPDLVYRIKACQAVAAICTADGDTAADIDAAQKQCPSLKHKIIARGAREGWVPFHARLHEMPRTLERIPTAAGDPMLIFFTSGTTGMPKMVLHDFRYPLGHIVTAKYWHKVDPDGLHLTVADTGWAKASWGKIYGQWIMGAGIFVYDYNKFKPKDLLALIEKYRITTFCAPPTIFRFFIKEGMQDFDLSSLQHATTAGEALNPEVFSRFKEYTGLDLTEGFGQSESTLLIGNIQNMPLRLGSMGRPSPQYSIQLMDEDGNIVDPGEEGEIVIDTRDGVPAGLFCGYYQDDKRTEEIWHDGYYHTRDIAWQDEDGYLWYVGRTDDVIKASGYRIGPFEIESVLMEHPAVLECAVTGAPDPIRGQVVKATIMLTQGYQPSDELIAELQDFVKHQTAPYKYPRIIEFVDALPKTISGKIKRDVLRGKHL
ncbi:AMP-binding protein [Neobittarella massiliensis]|uniref:Acetyl-coenzyme A synthetase n=1 Tax=uncultured Anaerotruncus sp. TaxID=905011 RepID=A0A1C6GX71_9FIRM|nr:AMP-binding protein [Neobittarella massiliensis]SCJ49838.1 Acetyl-coenzyme A synthetase [uncultured Anaerotruncus sp.]